MIEYLACGNCMSDEIIQPNGERSTRHMGGPAFFCFVRNSAVDEEREAGVPDWCGLL